MAAVAPTTHRAEPEAPVLWLITSEHHCTCGYLIPREAFGTYLPALDEFSALLHHTNDGDSHLAQVWALLTNPAGGNRSPPRRAPDWAYFQRVFLERVVAHDVVIHRATWHTFDPVSAVVMTANWV